MIRDNRVRDFNAQIKSNGATVNSVFVFPDDVLIERNLIICERQFSGGIRLGLSFGGGGTSPGSICEDGTCTPEHQNGIMRNNIIINCPADVGIYLNAAANSRIQHNTLYNTAGIDVRFAASTADLRSNLLNGQIRNRDGGTSSSAGNLTQVPLASFAAWFQSPAAADFRLVDGNAIVNLGVSAPLVTDDFCGNLRHDGMADIGAVEYDGDGICDTTVGGGQINALFGNGFE